MIQWKEPSIIIQENDVISHFHQISNEYARINMSNLELESISSMLINKLIGSINLNDPSAIFESLQSFKEFIKLQESAMEFPYAFLLEILNLLSYPNFEIQKLNSDFIVQLIVNNNFIGVLYTENNIIEIIQKEAESNNDLLIFFFPIIRILSSLSSSIFQQIIDIIPLSFFDICFEKKELIIETSLFLNIISQYEQNELMQSFILSKIRLLFELDIKEYQYYLAYSLHQLSNSPSFCFDLFQSLNLHEFVNFSLEKSKFHCVVPICNFLSNLFKNHFITSIPKHNLKLIVMYSKDFYLPKRCEASIDLLIKILEFGDVTNKSKILKIYPIASTFIEILRDIQPSFTVKYKIIQFLLSFASNVNCEDFTQLIAFGFFEIINFIITFSDDFLIEKCTKLMVDSFHFFMAKKTASFFADSLKKTVDFDSINSEQMDENESLNSFLLLLHKIINDECI